MGLLENGTLKTVTCCTECQKILREDWRFCPYCKTPVTHLSCPICREPVKSDWQYCPFCKNRIKPVGLGCEHSNEWLNTILKK